MMNAIKVIFSSFLLLLSVTIFYPTITYADENLRLNIITKENKVLFNLNNLKPGDWATRDLIVQNKSDNDFSYTTDAVFMSGSEELYNEFLLEITDGVRVLFKGKMKDFERLSPRLLKAKHEEDLFFKVDFPNHLGNEFQGKTFEVQFRFFINDAPPNPNPEDPKDPTDPTDPTDPENPTNPDPKPNPDPETPGDPEDPDPETPESPDEEDPDNSENPTVPGESDSEGPKNPDGNEAGPQRPIPPDRMNAPPNDGEVLPATATNMFNYIWGGVLLIAVGIVLFMAARRRSQLA